MSAIIVIVILLVVLYFIFYPESTAEEKKKRASRPFPALLTLFMFAIILMPMVITTLVLRWNNNISLDGLSEAQLYFSIFRMTTLYGTIVIGTFFISLGFYTYAAFVRQYWAYLIGVPFQGCTLVVMFVLLTLQPRMEIFQSVEVETTKYHLVHYQPTGSGSLYLFECDDGTICESTRLGFVDSYHYSSGQMAYHPAYDYIHIRATGFSVEEYIIPLHNE